jgi:bifunctional DNA-binding transcriptional regulator/antitoxin component of YhaV-PrlF toxin-antitoxin module
MKEVFATITTKSQVTIPVEVRQHLGVGPSDRIAFVLGPKGAVTLRVAKYGDVDSLAGAAGSLSKALAWEQMREIAYEDRLGTRYAKRK